MAKHPMQPIELVDGVARFKKNKIVDYLLRAGPFDMNHLAKLNDLFPDEDREQFAQLIGYSVSGASDLSYMSDELIGAAQAEVEKLLKPVCCCRCDNTGVIETGNNDLPCECVYGDRAVFNVAGRGKVSGAEIKKEGRR